MYAMVKYITGLKANNVHITKRNCYNCTPLEGAALDVHLATNVLCSISTMSCMWASFT